MFVSVIVPTSLALRLAGRDPLLLRTRKDSYWRMRGGSPDKHFEKLYTTDGNDGAA
jgi:hypothetical protein